MLITGERVQLFKSTSKLGDNHHCSHQERERETMTLARGRWIEYEPWPVCGWRQIFWVAPLISWAILKREGQVPGDWRKCKELRHLTSNASSESKQMIIKRENVKVNIKWETSHNQETKKSERVKLTAGSHSNIRSSVVWDTGKKYQMDLLSLF